MPKKELPPHVAHTRDCWEAVRAMITPQTVFPLDEFRAECEKMILRMARNHKFTAKQKEECLAALDDGGIYDAANWPTSSTMDRNIRKIALRLFGHEDDSIKWPECLMCVVAGGGSKTTFRIGTRESAKRIKRRLWAALQRAKKHT